MTDLGCTCAYCQPNRDTHARLANWSMMLTAGRADRMVRVANRHPNAPSLTLRAADYGIAPVRRWGMTDRAINHNRNAAAVIAWEYRHPVAHVWHATAWAMAAPSR